MATTKKTLAKKTVAKKPLRKASNGITVKPKVITLPEVTVKPKKKTPFQEYLRTTPDSTPSDTSDVFTGSRDGNSKLDKAYYDTYYAGQTNKRRTGADVVQYDAKGNRIRKTGGATKSTYKKGGAVKPAVKKTMIKSKKK